MSAVNPAAGPPADRRGQLLSLASIVVFDTGGPLLAYSLLHSGGSSTVVSLLLAGILPAFGVALGLARSRHLDAIGALVLFGIVVGTALALISGSARAVLLEGAVPTGVFAVACLGSLRSRRPLMYRFALESKGAGTPAGLDFEERWHRYPGFRHVFRVITVVWGVAFLAEAHVAIAEASSTSTAVAVTNALPFVVAGVVLAWMIPYSLRAKR